MNEFLETMAIIAIGAASLYCLYHILGYYALSSICDGLKEKVKELKETINKQGGISTSQNIKIEELSDELANSQWKARKWKKLCRKLIGKHKNLTEKSQLGLKMYSHVEDMGKEMRACIDERNEAKRAFSNQTQYMKRVEVDNMNLREMYRKCVAENEVLKQELNARNERINKLESQVNHKKYVPLSEQKEAECWECVNAIYQYFEQGEKYQKSKTQRLLADGLLYLVGSNGNPYVVDKKDFKPVEFPSKSVAQHMPEGFTIG